ncbi:MAG: hypothetical protein V8S98_06990 [Lachnospiraceae bacterium]
MDIREAVKDKANYADIVTYFQNLNILDLDQMALLIDTIDEMSEEIFEHYRALQLIFRKEAADIIEQRKQEGSFAFLTEAQQKKLFAILEKGCGLRAINQGKQKSLSEPDVFLLAETEIKDRKLGEIGGSSYEAAEKLT